MVDSVRGVSRVSGATTSALRGAHGVGAGSSVGAIKAQEAARAQMQGIGSGLATQKTNLGVTFANVLQGGLDLECEVPVNLAQAVLGTKIMVRTVDGKKVVLTIPPGTAAGKKFRVKGMGVVKGDRKGDQLVEIAVTMPEHLTPEQQELFKQFADQAGLAY